MKFYARSLYILAWSSLLPLDLCLPHSPIDSSSRVSFKSSVPAEWIQIGRANPEEMVEVHIGLVQNRFHELERHLLEVSNPAHHRYGQHLTVTEIHNLIRPAALTTDLVNAWLQSFNAAGLARGTSTSPAGDWHHISLSVGQLELLLESEYFVFRHKGHGQRIVRCLEWTLPAHLTDHIEVFEPTGAFVNSLAQMKYGVPAPSWEVENRVPTFDELVEEDLLDRGKLEIPSQDQLPLSPTALDACNRLAISPLCLQVLYGTYGYTPQIPKGHQVGVVNFLDGVTNRSDVHLYLQRYLPQAAATHAENEFSVKLVGGATDLQTAMTGQDLTKKRGFEAALDAQTVIGLTWPTKLVTYNVAGHPPFHSTTEQPNNTNEPYLTWLRYMHTQETVPSVISISYADNEQNVPATYARRVCAEFAQLGARGVSVLVASGDSGAAGVPKCEGSDQETRKFTAMFPASCPYVTAVGATRFIKPEMVAFDARSTYSSGGGFSEIFAQPAYQKSVVGEYLEKLGEENAGRFNPHGRAIPDISAMGYHFSVLWNGVAHLQDGTSASTPTAASVIALINDALLADGRPPLGFLNPWIYSRAHTAFNDVQIGVNFGCNFSVGFRATRGWDAATGFGTPWFPALKDLAMRYTTRPTLPWYYISSWSK